MFRHQSRREVGYRKHVPDASPVRTAAGRAQADDGKPSKPALQPRGENTGDRPGRLSALSGHVRTRRETLRFSFVVGSLLSENPQPTTLNSWEGAAPPQP